MVADGLLTRQRYREVPPRVDYELTERSRELMPVIGALARWGYNWTWSAPRPGEDINVGAVFRLAPGLIETPPGIEGSVDLIVEGQGDVPERRYRLTASGGRVEISESAEATAPERPSPATATPGSARSAPKAPPTRSRSAATAASRTPCSARSPAPPPHAAPPEPFAPTRSAPRVAACHREFAPRAMTRQRHRPLGR